MTNITKTDYPCEIVITLLPGRKIRGIHQCRYIDVQEDGQSMPGFPQQTLPEPVEVAALAAVLPDGAALAAQIAEQAKQIEQLQRERDEACAAGQQAQEFAQKAVDAAEAAQAKANAFLDDLRGTVKNVAATIGTMLNDVARKGVG